MLSRAQSLFPLRASGEGQPPVFAFFDNISGEKIKEVTGYDVVYPFNGGVARVMQLRRDTQYYGFIDGSMTERLPLRALAYCSDFSESSAVFGVYTPAGTRYGYMKYYDGWAIKPIFTAAKPFVEGFATAKDSASGKWGFVRRSYIGWEWAVKPTYAEAGSLRQGLAPVSFDGVAYGFANPAGFLAIPPEYKPVSTVDNMYFKDYRAVVRKLAPSAVDSVVILEKNGKTVFQIEADDAFPFSETKMIAGKKDASGKMLYGCFDERGNALLPMQYEILPGEGGMGFKDGLWATTQGFVDEKGAIVCTFENKAVVKAGPMKNNLAIIALADPQRPGYSAEVLLHRDGRILWQGPALPNKR